MAQLNINDLYETARKKELNKFKTFDTILKRCHNKIKNYASNHKTECIYEVPEFIIGTPLFDRDELTEYISSSLLKISFTHSSSGILTTSFSKPIVLDIP